MNTATEIAEWLEANCNEANKAGMARYGIDAENAVGVRLPDLRAAAKPLRGNTPLARELWATGIHEARIMASMIASPKDFTEQDMRGWVADFRSWDLCDQCCNNFFYRLPFAYKYIYEYAEHEGEFDRRTGFSILATLAVHDRKAPDSVFENYLPLIIKYSTDPRNYVRKAVNWALRSIGKRNYALCDKAAETARQLIDSGDKTARWIGRDALTELTDETILARIGRHSK